MEISVIEGEFMWRELGHILGRPIYPKAYEDKPEYPCSLAGGKISYKIYNDTSGSSAHVCLHSNGVCFTPSLDVAVDKALAMELYGRVLELKTRRKTMGTVYQVKGENGIFRLVTDSNKGWCCVECGLFNGVASKTQKKGINKNKYCQNCDMATLHECKVME